MNKAIYLDYAATTPVDKRVVNKMLQYLDTDGIFGNPASRSHSFGWQAETAVDQARIELANLINADPKEIIWTSGATEANNLAIKGVAEFYKAKGNHIITIKTEHKAVLDPCRYLESKNYDITYLEPQIDGRIDIEELKQAITDKTILISVMHVNNEIGIIQDLYKIGEITKKHNILLHSDAAQSLGKINIDLTKLSVDLMSFSGHKIYAPKGIGALYIRKRKPRIRLAAQIHGGSHERGMRSGTLATHQIVAFGEACRIAFLEMKTEQQHIKKLAQRLINGLEIIEEIKINSSKKYSYPGILNISFKYIEGESLMMALKNIAVSSGSACTSASLEPSYVLRALGLSDELCHSSIRFSIGRFTTETEIDAIIKTVIQAVLKLRALSPLWEMYQEGIDVAQVQW